LGYAGQILKLAEKVRVVAEEAVDGAFKDDDLDLLVILALGHDVPHFQDVLVSHETEGRIIEHRVTVAGVTRVILTWAVFAVEFTGNPLCVIGHRRYRVAAPTWPLDDGIGRAPDGDRRGGALPTRDRAKTG
jgi:hypothetical protein